ncbi:MAG: DUF1365 domain-containing protein [Pseudomonadales bacterium]
MHSAIYKGTVGHCRYEPRAHKFAYQVFMMYLDLDELDTVFSSSRLWSVGKPALAWLKREDYLPGQESLIEAVRDRVEAEVGSRPVGPIRMLANLRYFGYIINPITCYYCFDATGQHVEYTVLEVTNTPWNQRHSYVLVCDPDRSEQRISFDKELHVSPFNPMNMVYQWSANQPDKTIGVCLENHLQDRCVFKATMSFKREPISSRSLRSILLSYPFMTIKVCAAIYWQALKLLIRRVPPYPHPKVMVK